MVAETVEAGAQALDAAVAVGKKEQVRTVAQEEVETVEAPALGAQVFQVGQGRFGAGEKIDHQASAAWGIGFERCRVAVVGDSGPTPAVGGPHPGAARLQVAAGQDLRVIPPKTQWGRGSLIKLVAIGGQYQRIIRTDPVGEENQAHCVTIDL